MSTTTPELQDSGGAPQFSQGRRIYLIAAILAGVVGATIGYTLYGQSLADLGIPDPGVAISFGLPFLRGFGTLIACVGIGSYMLAAFGPPHRADGTISVDAYKAVRTGVWCMVIWGSVAIIQIPMNLSDLSGTPLSTTIHPSYWGQAVEQVAISMAWLWVAILAFGLAIWSSLTNKWIMQLLFFVISWLTLLPLALQGHSASGGSHDWGVNSYLWHMFFATLWIGGLAALIQHGLRRGPHMDVLVQRYSFIALISIIVVAVSGVVNAMLRIRWSDWFTTEYGWIITAKTVLLVLLSIFGYVQRSRIIPQLRKDPTNRRPFVKLATFELLLMAITIGVAVSLSRIPPPLPKTLDLSTMDIELGFTLTEPPTWMGMITHWRLDLIFGVGAIILQVLYMWAYIALKRRGGTWPVSRLLWWTLGNFMLFMVTSSGIGMYAMTTFSIHMIQHMFLSMGIPIAWALAGPITLFLRALPAAGRTGVPGPREWIVAFMNNPVSTFLTNPLVAAVQFVIGFYALYFTPLFGLMMDHHFGHLFMVAHFIISGYIFYWVSIGIDSAHCSCNTSLSSALEFVFLKCIDHAVRWASWSGLLTAS